MSKTEAPLPALACGGLVRKAPADRLPKTKHCRVCGGKGYEVHSGYSLREVCFSCGGKITRPARSNKANEPTTGS